MRTLLAAAVAATSFCACSVPDKQAPADPDAGVGTDAAMPDSIVDDAAPDTMLIAAPDEFSREAVAMFQFSSDEANVTFECSIDGESPVPCTSPYSRSLGDGSHSFMVRATDSAGNSDDTPAEHLWSIDRVVPNTTFVKTPPLADNSVMVRFEFESNEESVVFECSLDNASYRACTSGESIGPIGDGSHSYAVRAVDRAGNVDASPAIHAWTVDTSTPDTEILSGPTGDVGVTTASFTFISPDAGSGATFLCSLDGGAFTACTSPRNYSALGEGNHTFAVRVRDSVGNLDPTPATRTWRVDLQDPNTTITAGPTGVVDSASASFTFMSSEQGSTFECQLDGGAFAACASPQNFTALAQGPHTFAVRAKDAAGHLDPTPATRNWTVDTVAPDITITSGPAQNGTTGPEVTFVFTVSEGTPQCSLDGAAFTACSSPYSFTAETGMHELRIRAADAAGNTTTVTRAFTVECTAPTPAGAAGLLHFDADAQLQANAVGGGAAATLGDTDAVEAFDPAFVAAARFGGGLQLTAAEADRVAWPVMLGTTSDFTIEFWIRPGSAGDLVTSGDGRIAIRAVPQNGSNVRIAASVVMDAAATTKTTTSANVATGQWHHVLASLGNGTLRLWVDGVQTSVAMVTLETPLALDSLRIGSLDAATAFDGTIDELWLGLGAVTTDAAATARYCPAN